MAESNSQYLHEVAITAIIVKDGKYFIARRSLQKKRFPGMWTVPGGKLETGDYLQLPKDTEHYWYNVLERALRREVKEEINADVENIKYLTSLATVHVGGSPSLVISCTADYAGGEIKLKEDELDQHAWVSLEEAKGYNLIDGIYDELVMAQDAISYTREGRSDKKFEWQRARS